MAILRGLSSRLLPCGCLVGVYETYEGAIVTVVDARGVACANPAHVDGAHLSEDGQSAAPIGTNGPKGKKDSRIAS
jgi:hypothetical protein